jgi:hypothetical protein
MNNLKTRIIYIILALVTMCCGLLSRSDIIPLPHFVVTYAGDTLWSLMVFICLRIVLIKAKTWKIATITLFFSFVIEFFQLYDITWINEIRSTLFGRLVLGSGFLPSDLVCYTTGTLIGITIDLMVRKTMNTAL